MPMQPSPIADTSRPCPSLRFSMPDLPRCVNGPALARLHEPQRELVRRHLRRARRLVAGVGGIAQEVAFGLDDEARGAHLVDDDRFVDPMQRLAFRNALART